MTGPGRVRLLHVITRLDRGGSTENTLLSAAGMDRERYSVTVAVGPTRRPRRDLEAEVRSQGVRFVDVRDLVRAPHPARDLCAYRQLRHLVRQGFDVVHTHTSKAGILGRRAAFRAGVAAVVHTPHGHVFYGYYGALLTSLFVHLERRAARWCHRLVALTAVDRDEHLAYRVGLPDQWAVIHSGIDFRPLEAATAADGATLRVDLGIPADAILVGTVGRLTAVKGQEVLLRAFATLARQCPRVRLLVVGDGEEEANLRALAASLGVTRQTVFAGWLAPVGPALRAMDIFVLPSRNEGMGRALVEAMYVGLPAVASRVGGVPELLAGEECGFLVPPGEVGVLAGVLERLRGNAGLRHRLGAAAAARARAYGHVSMVEKLDALYRDLLGAVSAGRETRGGRSREREVGHLAR